MNLSISRLRHAADMAAHRICREVFGLLDGFVKTPGKVSAIIEAELRKSATEKDINVINPPDPDNIAAVTYWSAWHDMRNLINELRKEEGASVEIFCDNENGSGPDNAKIAVTGSWTEWKPREFIGVTWLDALKSARDAMEKAR